MTAGLAIVFSACGAAAIAYVLARQGVQAVARWRLRFDAGARQSADVLYLFMDPAWFWWLSLLVAGSAGGLVYAWRGAIWLALSVALAALLAPRWLAAWGSRRRRASLDAQLPELLTSLAWALRGGASIQGALRVIVSESPLPAQQEFGLLLREQRMGLSFDQALEGLYRRMPSAEIALVVAVLGIAAQSGGSLAEALQRLSETIEARLRVQRRLRTLAAQGVLQAWIMGALPLVLLFALQALEPEAMHGLWHTPSGWMLLGVLAVLLASGAWFIRRIVRVEP